VKICIKIIHFEVEMQIFLEIGRFHRVELLCLEVCKHEEGLWKGFGCNKGFGWDEGLNETRVCLR
jgi:hypothetical protein